MGPLPLLVVAGTNGKLRDTATTVVAVGRVVDHVAVSVVNRVTGFVEDPVVDKVTTLGIASRTIVALARVFVPAVSTAGISLL